MSDFEKLEKELAALSPSPPTRDFMGRVEHALGDAGNMAMCHFSDKVDKLKKPLFHSSSLIRLSFGIAVAASIAVIFYFIGPLIYTQDSLNNDIIIRSEIKPHKVEEDLESPLHGITSNQLEDFSGIPLDGWLDPHTEEKFILRVDEGIVDRASGLPARQYRYHYVDQTLWSHPATATQILSTTPRQEVYLIDLELY